MGPLHPHSANQEHRDHQWEIQDLQNPDPYSNPPVVIKPTFVTGQDVVALKRNILTAHALGLLPTRKLFESIQAQGTLENVSSHAASYAQSIVDNYVNSLPLQEQLNFDYRSMYRQLMEEYIGTVTAVLTQAPQLHLEEVLVK